MPSTKKIINPEIGRIVLSKVGRDKRKYFVIINIIDCEYCFIADGDLRKITKPKKKKIKHLKLTPNISDLVLERISDNKIIFDFEIKQIINSFILENNARIAKNKVDNIEKKNNKLDLPKTKLSGKTKLSVLNNKNIKTKNNKNKEKTACQKKM